MADDPRLPQTLLAAPALSQAFLGLIRAGRVLDEDDVQSRLLPLASRWGVKRLPARRALLCLLQCYPQHFTESARQLLHDEMLRAGLRDQVAAGFSSFGWRTSVTPQPLQRAIPGEEFVVNDASGLSPTFVREIVAIDSIDRARAAVARARESGLQVSVAGTRHSEGGQSASPGSLNLDMLGLKDVDLLQDGKGVRIQTGATWAGVQARVARGGRAVEVMQTSNVFSVGGSLSVNCHGRTPGQPPIISTVRSLELLTADGQIRRCSRSENPELFRHAIGGYGLFGVILEAELETAEDGPCQLEVERLAASDYPSAFAATLTDPSIELAWGRLAPTLNGEALIHRVRRIEGQEQPGGGRIAEEQPGTLWHAALEVSKHGPRLLAFRWALEKRMRRSVEVGTRNGFMAPSVAPLRQYRINEGRRVDILHEYFVPRDAYWNFVEGLSDVQARNGHSSLNITIRDVGRDTESALPYARQDSFAFVLYYNQRLTRTANEQQARLQRDLIDLALSCEGTFYLPYQLHYTSAQLRSAYPGIDGFFETKLRHDPDNLFSNTFYERFRARQP